MKQWYQMETKELLKEMDSSSDGLTKEQVEDRLAKYGKNKLEEGEKKTPLQIFLKQFKDLLVIVLIIAAVISAITGDGKSTLVIVAVLMLNAVLGTLQEVKAQKSLDALKKLSSPHVKVMRNGIKEEIESQNLVPGDIVIAEAGDIIAADGRIIENYSLQVNEASLTGESTNIDKKEVTFEEEVPLADRLNMVYSGSLVTYGRGVICVTETGMKTEIGKIATLMNKTKEKKTPLQESLNRFSGRLAVGILIISALVFGIEMIQGMKVLDALLFAVALAVAAIPEALGSIVTIVQAMGTRKMAQENAIIKSLAAVESLGCVSVICSDKTGTLTQNKMTVQEIYIGEEVLKPEDMDLKQQLHRYMLYSAALTNDSSIVDGKGIGDPTEYALLEMFRHVNGFKKGGDDLHLSTDDLREMLVRHGEVPFDSDRKLMSTKHYIHGVPTVFTKGALDVLLERCKEIRLKDDKIRPITDEDKKKIKDQNRIFSENGLRVLAFAYKETDEELNLETEKDYIFLGLISEMDPPRPESVEAVKNAHSAGIRTIMITGDHKITARAIARQIGIFEEGDMAVTGMELDAMTDEELAEKIEKISVYARVSPENKIRIVDAWQKKGKIVSMTGDGVNDAPALKQADIGVAMGITGTEVSKDAASMILSDDNFATIIKAVANGRTVYANIKNTILFLLSGNLAAILTVLFTSFAGLSVPFKAVQLLFINLVTDSLPALAIGMEPDEGEVLKAAPRDPKANLMDKSFNIKMILQGALISVVVVVAYLIGHKVSPAMACTMAFLTLTMARLFHGFNCRGKGSLIKLGFRKNPYSLGAFLIGTILVALSVFTVVGRNLFAVSVLGKTEIIQILGLAVAPTVLVQIIKIVKENIK